MIKVFTDMHKKPSTKNKVLLMKILFYLKMVESGFVAIHLNKFNTIVN